MAQQDTTPKVGIQQGADRAHFLTQTDDDGFHWNDARLGSDGAKHGVLVFNKQSSNPVMFRLEAGCASLIECMTPDEARMLANALLLAADYADSGQHLLMASQRQDAQEVAA